MTPFAAVLTRWAESLANGAARLDPLARARLRALSGRLVEITVDPPGETVWMTIDGETVRLGDDASGRVPSVRVRGSPAALAATLLGVDGSHAKLDIDGDESILTDLRAIAGGFRPDGIPALEDLVGDRAAQAMSSLFEVGISALATLGRQVRDEGGRFARDTIGQRYLTTPEFDRYLQALQRLRVRVDRLTVRTELAESRRSRFRE